VIWYAISAGMCLSFGVCHLALAVKRPIQTSYLAFAIMMGFIAPFQLVLGALNTTTSKGSAIELTRWAVALANGSVVLFAVFVHLYAEKKVPRVIAAAFFAINLGFLAYDLLSPTGLVIIPGRAFTRASLGALQAWQALNAVTVLWAVGAGWRMARRGRPRQGTTLMFGSLAFLISVLVDLLRNLFGYAWPYVGGFGVMVMTIVLSGRLALDFRNDEMLLARLLKEAMRVRDQLNTPLQTLHLGLEIAVAEGKIDRERLSRLQRAVDRLIELGRRLRAEVEA
jgi:hypothetical protein